MENSKDIRWRQRFENFKKSYNLLEKYSDIDLKNDLELAGIIKIFEITFELSWKVLKDYLEREGYIIKSPREAIKQAFQIQIIDNGSIWLEILSNRNLTAHIYDKYLSDKILKDNITIYLQEFKKLHDILEKEL